MEATIGGAATSCGRSENDACTNRVTDDYGTMGVAYYERTDDNAGTPSDVFFATVGRELEHHQLLVRHR